MKKYTVLGAGSWGTTLADLLASKGFETTLWARDSGLAASMEKDRENSVYLPGVKLCKDLRTTFLLEEALGGAGLVVSAIPSHGLRHVWDTARAFIAKDAVIVSATKGIEEETFLTPSAVLKDALKEVLYSGIAVLSGPSFAKEVVRRLPAAICAASASSTAAKAVQEAFSTPYFRVYTNSDAVGVELGGAFKNVIAIAAGISDGLELGLNARAALITRGLAEMSRLGCALGARPETFAGLSGLGDLVLTCTASLSRNYSTGVAVGRGKTIKEITSGMKMVAEGVRTSKAAMGLANSLGVEMPIIAEVFKVIAEGKSPKAAVMELMTRGLKGE
ncbi:MAG: NAD(P)-dependent glycerol-3-phosphate dehydrogenase [Deltaproteobacteria bacterium]|nr:NAD(P)-dependent glycerol-3-phosphate dehydrogenase [Deltaproteobacteria bacterium]